MAGKVIPPELDDEPIRPDENPSLGDDLRALVAEARAAFDSEFAYQSARAGLAGKIIARIAGLAALALALVFFVLMALVVGLLLALAPVLSAWGALGVVVAGLLVLTALAGLGVKAGVRRLKRVLGKGDGA